MSPFLLLQIAGRVLLSVSANAVQKRLLLAAAPLRGTWLWTYALMLGPAMLVAALTSFASTTGVYPRGGFWVDAVAAGVVDALGNLAMIAALRSTELSIFGPLNAFRPVLALLFGWLFLAEAPSGMGFAGIALTIGGAVLLLRDESAVANEAQTTPQAFPLRMLGLRLAGLILSTFAAVFLKRAASQASAEMTLAAWTVSGLVCFVAASILLRPRAEQVAVFARHRVWLIAHAAMFFGMQWLTIRIFQSTLLAYSFVFFQFAIVLQVLVGWRLFREPAFRALRLAGCAVMAAGTALILWRG